MPLRSTAGAMPCAFSGGKAEIRRDFYLCALVFLAIGCSYEKDDAVDAVHAHASSDQLYR